VFSDGQRRSEGEYDYIGLVRAKARSSREQVHSELTSITEIEFRQAGIHPEPVVRVLMDQIIGDARGPLWLLLAAVLTALLVACLNIAGLLTARWTGRTRELVIRSALGASASRVTRPVVVEALLLSVAGAATGVLVAGTSLKLLVATVPVDIPRLQEVAFNWRVLLFAAVLTAGVGLACGLLPGWRASRSNAADMLKTTSLFATATGGSVRAGKWLIAGQVALTALLLVFGGLLVASFAAVLSVDRGFDTGRALAADVTLPATRYSTEASRLQFYEAFLQRIEAMPAIEHAGMSQRLPLEGLPSVDALVRFEDNTPSFNPSLMSVTNYFYISDGYPAAIGMRLHRGRFPTRQDHGRPVALITESTAQRLWPNSDAIGQRFFRGDPRRKRMYEVIGVVADLPISSLEQPPGFTAFLPASESGRGTMSVVVRTSMPAAAVVGALRAALDDLDRELPLHNVRTIEQVLSGSIATRRFQMVLIGSFSGAALLLACLGLYGVIATAIGRNRRELALRIVLGSTPRDLVARVFTEGLLPVFAGALVGVAAALGLSSFIRASLFGISPHNPAIIASAVLLILVASALACLIPAISAARTPPALVLRE
jgi:putative ABC transport system permease protein